MSDRYLFNKKFNNLCLENNIEEVKKYINDDRLYIVGYDKTFEKICNKNYSEIAKLLLDNLEINFTTIKSLFSKNKKYTIPNAKIVLVIWNYLQPYMNCHYVKHFTYSSYDDKYLPNSKFLIMLLKLNYPFNDLELFYHKYDINLNYIEDYIKNYINYDNYGLSQLKWLHKYYQKSCCKDSIKILENNFIIDIYKFLDDNNMFVGKESSLLKLVEYKISSIYNLQNNKLCSIIYRKYWRFYDINFKYCNEWTVMHGMINHNPRKPKLYRKWRTQYNIRLFCIYVKLKLFAIKWKKNYYSPYEKGFIYAKQKFLKIEK